MAQIDNGNGTTEKLTFVVNDNLTGITKFNIRANGMEF